jgi:hypothetical protein
MGKFNDLTGQVFSKLVVIGISDKRGKYNNIYWKCKCECGNETIVAAWCLLNGETKSCGCLKTRHQYKDITGQKFGKLTVISYSETRNKKPFWLCRCDCGKEKIMKGSSLKNGSAASCGCARGRINDLTGQLFGKWIVVSFSEMKRGAAYWVCQCECGKEKIINGSSLTFGSSKSCGCAIIPNDLTGLQFGNLTVIRNSDKRGSNNETYWV